MRIIKFEKLNKEVITTDGYFYIQDPLTYNFDKVEVNLKINQVTHFALIQTNNSYGMFFGIENLKNELIEQGFIDDTKLTSRKSI